MTARIEMTAAELAADLTAKDFETAEFGETWPFFDDEDGQAYTGYGHIDKVEFARLVSEYEQWFIDGEQVLCSPSAVRHGFAEIEPVWNSYFDWRFRLVEFPSEITVPITWVERNG